MLGPELRACMAEPRIRVGTSGYSYLWNEGKPTPFDWYLQQGFDTVEINASFYRFPTESWVQTWLKSPDSFDFCIKVHRAITHYVKLRGKALDLWRRFVHPLRPLEGRIAFWLFQLPWNFKPTDANFDAARRFLGEVNLGNAAVLEFREPAWWKHQDLCRDAGAAFCSVDAPQLPRDIVTLNDVTYLRLHGREEWYAYEYTEAELRAIVREVKRRKAAKRYILLNNDHGMLPNGRFLLKLTR